MQKKLTAAAAFAFSFLGALLWPPACVTLDFVVCQEIRGVASAPRGAILEQRGGAFFGPQCSKRRARAQHPHPTLAVVLSSWDPWPTPQCVPHARVLSHLLALALTHGWLLLWLLLREVGAAKNDRRRVGLCCCCETACVRV